MSRVIAGRYRIEQTLGGGGTAIVHRAVERGSGTKVAVKELRPQFAADAALRLRFLREAELARQLRHPGIVRVFDAGEHDGRPFIVLELVEGPTLRQLLDREGRLEFELAWSIFACLTRALDHAHACGVIHRDVKPENIFLASDGVKLGDFGNARVVSLASVTGASLTWGTPEYVAPEVFVRGRADPRSDLYSLGVVFHEMLTGRVPWPRNETLTRIGGGAARTPVVAPTGQGEATDRLIRDLLAYAPALRPASGAEAMARLVQRDADVTIRSTDCAGCGASRPADLPRCLSCGELASSFAHDPEQNWGLVLRSLEDDATTLERLLRLLDAIAQPADRPLFFLNGQQAMYSAEEISSGIALPTVLFADLAESTARALEALFRRHELDAIALRGRPRVWKPRGSDRRSLLNVLPAAVVVGVGVAKLTASLALGASLGVGLISIPLVIGAVRRRARLRSAQGLLTLRGPIDSTPAADAFLAQVGAAAEGVRAQDVRALLADAGTEIYRLTRRAEQQSKAAPGEGQLFERTVAVAPALLARIRAIAVRLDDLDRALEGQTEGELMQTMGRLERAAGAPGADRAALAATRRDLDAALERRHAAEQDRARLSAKLCQLLGQLRVIYRQEANTTTAADVEARALEAASAEVEALLAAPSA